MRKEGIHNVFRIFQVTILLRILPSNFPPETREMKPPWEIVILDGSTTFLRLGLVIGDLGI